MLGYAIAVMTKGTTKITAFVYTICTTNMNEQVLCARHCAKPCVLSFLIYFGTKSYEVCLLS